MNSLSPWVRHTSDFWKSRKLSILAYMKAILLLLALAIGMVVSPSVGLCDTGPPVEITQLTENQLLTPCDLGVNAEIEANYPEPEWHGYSMAGFAATPMILAVRNEHTPYSCRKPAKISPDIWRPGSNTAVHNKAKTISKKRLLPDIRRLS